MTRVFVTDVMGADGFRICGAAPAAKDGPVGVATAAQDDSGPVGRAAFMERQRSAHAKAAEGADACGSRSDANEVDENGVAKPEQTAGGIGAVAEQHAKKGKGREAFMKRQASAWKGGNAAPGGTE